MKAVPKIIENHEYMSIVLGKRRLTASYGGTKASGGIPHDVFNMFDKAFHGRDAKILAMLGFAPDSKPKNGEIVKAFASKMDTIWPDWNKETKMPSVGDTVTANFGTRRGLDTGVVYKVSRSYVFANWAKNGNTGVHFDMLVK